MKRERPNHDIERSENEGFGLQEMESEHFLYLFLGRVQREFVKNPHLRYLEDAVPEVVGSMTKEECVQFIEVSKSHFNPKEKCDHHGLELEGNLSSHLKWFLNKKEWKKLEKLEHRRIMEHERHAGQGIG